MVDKKILYFSAIAVIVVAIIFFIGSSSDSSNEQAAGKVQSQLAGAWVDIELKDVRTGENFKISDFSGKPILLESFAVWCPTCTRQQGEIKKFHEEIGDSVISISLDTDPNEDEARVLQHIERNGFTWYYAVSPIDLTRSLIDQFGVSIVNAPSAPMVLICEDGNASKLKEEVERGC